MKAAFLVAYLSWLRCRSALLTTGGDVEEEIVRSIYYSLE